MTKIKDMTQGKPLPLIIQFALPLMLGNVFQNLYTLVDTMVVGKALGVDALAALGATDWFYWMIVGIIQGVTQGFAIPISRHFGAKQYEDVRQVVGASTVLSAICSAALMLGGHLVTRPVLYLLQTPADIIHWSELYLRILISAGPVVVGYNLLSCILRALGDGQSPLRAMIWSSLTNIALDLLFVLGFDWGIVGAAAATVIAQVVQEEFYGKTARLLVKNGTGKDIIVEAEHVSVNGYTLDAWLYDTVVADTVRYCHLDLFETGLAENGIDAIESISFQLSFLDAHTYETIARTEQLAVDVKD